MIKNKVEKEHNHGDITFPLSVYKNMPNINECILFCHWHDEVEFFYLTKGQATFFIDTKAIEVKSGEAIFVNSGEIHTAYSKDFLNCEFYAIVFDLNMLQSSVIGECQSKYLFPLTHKTYLPPQKISLTLAWELAILDQLNLIIDKYLKREPAYEISIIASLYIIIYNLILNDKLTLNTDSSSEHGIQKLEQFKKSLSYIHSNYGNKISMLDIAQDINMSQFHFCRFFKKMSGNTPIEYLIHYRINQAEKLLNDTDKKIMDIALDVGFDTVSHFIKTFKKIKKCTPSKFREMYIQTIK